MIFWIVFGCVLFSIATIYTVYKIWKKRNENKPLIQDSEVNMLQTDDRLHEVSLAGVSPISQV